MAYIINEKDNILIFEIDRPNIHNAINFDVLAGFKQLVTEVQANKEIKLVVITGAGDKSFCSGGDLSVFHELKTAEESYAMLSAVAEELYKVATLEVPTIALINGTAVGGGCEIATLCDFRLVKKEAKCGFIQGRLAITTGWGGGTYLLEKGMSYDKALKMLIEATPYNSAELLEMGWATEVFEGDKMLALQDFVSKMIIPHENVLKAYKKQVIRKWEHSKLFERIMEEVKECSVLWEADAHHDAVNSFLTKKK